MRHLFLVLSTFVLVSGFSDCRAEKSQESAALDGLRPIVRLDDAKPLRWTLNERLIATNTPGIAIAVIDDFRIAWVHVAGLAEASTQRLVTTETLFHAKSISKPVTAYATLLLAQQGTIDLETDITEYLQSWSLPDNEFTANHSITTAQILSHSAGFTRWGVDSYKVGEDLPTLLESLNGDAPAKYKPVNIDYLPGSKTRYSGGGYGVLQQMLIDVSGTDFASLMRELVILPLDMDHSHFPQPMAADLEPVAAAGHDSSGRVIDGKRETLPIMAAGGLWTTADDLALFVIEVMKAWSGKSELMSQSVARKMLTQQLDDRGLGFEVDQSDGLLTFSHTGSGDGFKALIIGEPASGKGLVVLANSDGAGVIRKSTTTCCKQASFCHRESRRSLDLRERKASMARFRAIRNNQGANARGSFNLLSFCIASSKTI